MSYQQNNSRPTPQPRKKSFLNDWRQPHPASDAPMDGGKYPAQFMWEVTNAGKIVLKISDGVFKEGAKSPHKEVELGAYDRNVLFETLLEASNNPDFKTKQLVVKKHQFVRTGGASRMSDSPITQVTLTIIRDDAGQITLGYSKGDYKVTTRFKGPNSSVIMYKNEAGEVVEDRGCMSRMYLRAWVNFHRMVLDRMELEGWEPQKPREGTSGGANGNGGYNQNKGNPNQSNHNSSFDDEFDDIAF
jgi:hypothetical protein